MIPVVIVNKEQKQSPPSSDPGVAAAVVDSANSVVPAESTIASGTASDQSNSESEEVALEGRFGLWESFGRLSPKVLMRKRFDYRRRKRSLSCPVAAVNMGIARNFSL